MDLTRERLVFNDGEISILEAAHRLACGRTKVYEMLASGELKRGTRRGSVKTASVEADGDDTMRIDKHTRLHLRDQVTLAGFVQEQWDPEAGNYRNGWTDEKIARAQPFKCTIANVSGVRHAYDFRFKHRPKSATTIAQLDERIGNIEATVAALCKALAWDPQSAAKILDIPRA